jgi:glutaredoxin-like protein
MAMISTEDQEFLKEHFSHELKDEVKIVFFTQKQSPLTLPAQTCMYCKETGELFEEIATLSDKITVETLDFVKDAELAKQYGIDKIPAAVIVGPESHGMKFYGIPSGYEFAALIEDLVWASKGESGFSQETKEELKKVDAETHIQVFVTPTCPYCPQVASIAHRMAIENPLIRADVIEASEFPYVVQKYKVMGVHKTVINEKTQFQGAVPENRFVAEVLKAQKQVQTK